MSKIFLLFAGVFLFISATAANAVTIVSKCDKPFKVTDLKGNIIEIPCSSQMPKISDDSIVTAGEAPLILLLENGNVVKMPAGSQILIPLGKEIVVQRGNVTVTKPNVIEAYQPVATGLILDSQRRHDEPDISPIR